MKKTTAISTLKTACLMLFNKGIALLIAALLVLTFMRSEGGPFIELLYSITLLASIIVVAPVVRLLIFPEAAEFAEQGELRKHLTGSRAFTPMLVHYFFATAISFICTILCVIPLLKI